MEKAEKFVTGKSYIKVQLNGSLTFEWSVLQCGWVLMVNNWQGELIILKAKKKEVG